MPANNQKSRVFSAALQDRCEARRHSCGIKPDVPLHETKRAGGGVRYFDAMR